MAATMVLQAASPVHAAGNKPETSLWEAIPEPVVVEKSVNLLLPSAGVQYALSAKKVSLRDVEDDLYDRGVISEKKTQSVSAPAEPEVSKTNIKETATASVATASAAAVAQAVQPAPAPAEPKWEAIPEAEPVIAAAPVEPEPERAILETNLTPVQWKEAQLVRDAGDTLQNIDDSTATVLSTGAVTVVSSTMDAIIQAAPEVTEVTEAPAVVHFQEEVQVLSEDEELTTRALWESIPTETEAVAEEIPAEAPAEEVPAEEAAAAEEAPAEEAPEEETAAEGEEPSGEEASEEASSEEEVSTEETPSEETAETAAEGTAEETAEEGTTEEGASEEAGAETAEGEESAPAEETAAETAEEGTEAAEEAPAAPEEPKDSLVYSTASNYVNVRASGAPDAEIVGKLYAGSVGKVLEPADENGWIKISSGSVTGYVSESVVATGDIALELAHEVAQTKGVVRATLRVHAAPAIDSDVISLIGMGQQLDIKEEVDGWYRVDSDGGEGYISADFTDTETYYPEAVSIEAERIAAEREAAERARAAQQSSGQQQASTQSQAAPAVSQNASSLGQQVVNYATQFLGNPYVWGGTSLTNGTDCSGFTMSVYSHFGVSLPHYDASQRSCGIAINSLAEALPGDLICYYGHVGIYIGNGQIVHASNPRTGITIGSATYRQIAAIRRIFY